jgi:cell wall assembly regulator SMI1
VSAALVEQSWSRIEAWLGEHAPVTFGTLNGSADPAAIAEAERVLGFALPADLVASLARHDGADEDSPGRFELTTGFWLMPLAEYDGYNTELGYARDGVVTGRFDSREPDR